MAVKRITKVVTVTPKKTAAKKKPTIAKAPAKSEAKPKVSKSSVDLDTKAQVLRDLSAWPELLALLEGAAKPSTKLQKHFCRALSHVAAPTEAQIAKGEKYAAGLVALDKDDIDALLCLAALAPPAEKADKALAAYKASGFKENDALELLQGAQKGGQAGQAGHGGGAEEVSRELGVC